MSTEDVNSQKRKPNMSEKTPTSVLQELCMQKKEVLIFDDILEDPSTKTFTGKAKAFGLEVEGSGRSKKEAKHEACANMIAELVRLKRFLDFLPTTPQVLHTPHTSSETDAVCALLDICVQRNYPLAQFQELQSYGESHRPVFTVICTLSSIKRTGTCSTKKGAKQIAARAVLEIVQNFQQNEEQQQIATVDFQPPEKLFRTYRELKKGNIKPITVKLRNRHNYFLRLPEPDRSEAEQILIDNSGIYGSNKDKVDLICKALKVNYKVQDIPDHKYHHQIFYLTGEHDCVLVGKDTDLYNNVINHFAAMLNIQMF